MTFLIKIMVLFGHILFHNNSCFKVIMFIVTFYRMNRIHYYLTSFIKLVGAIIFLPDNLTLTKLNR